MRTAVFVPARPLNCAALNRDRRMPPICAPRKLLKSLAASLFVPAATWAQAPLPPLKLAMIEGLSGGNANGGEAVFRNLVWATERVNERGGVRLPGGARRLALARY